MIGAMAEPTNLARCPVCGSTDVTIDHPEVRVVNGTSTVTGLVNCHSPDCPSQAASAVVDQPANDQ
jgi:hypothetical protein